MRVLSEAARVSEAEKPGERQVMPLLWVSYYRKIVLNKKYSLLLLTSAKLLDLSFSTPSHPVPICNKRLVTPPLLF